MEIKINNKKVWKRKKAENAIYCFIWIIVTWLSIKAFEFMIEFMDFNGKKYNLNLYVGIGIAIVLIIFAIKLHFEEIYSKSLKYYLEDDKLLKTYKRLVKTKDSARLQIINSVDVTQGIVDKLFDMYNLVICYGMGDGHYFCYRYLTEKQADDLMNKIKITGKPVILK